MIRRVAVGDGFRGHALDDAGLYLIGVAVFTPLMRGHMAKAQVSSRQLVALIALQRAVLPERVRIFSDFPPLLRGVILIGQSTFGAGRSGAQL